MSSHTEKPFHQEPLITALFDSPERAAGAVRGAGLLP